MTAREAYDSDPTFRALVGVWVAGRRCPLVLADRCLELDLRGAAAWAAAEPDRKPPWPRKGEKESACGPVPTLCDGGWYWQHPTPSASAADVPKGNVPYAVLRNRDRAKSTYQYRQHETAGRDPLAARQLADSERTTEGAGAGERVVVRRVERLQRRHRNGEPQGPLAPRRPPRAPLNPRRSDPERRTTPDSAVPSARATPSRTPGAPTGSLPCKNLCHHDPPVVARVGRGPSRAPLSQDDPCAPSCWMLRVESAACRVPSRLTAAGDSRLSQSCGRRK